MERCLNSVLHFYSPLGGRRKVFNLSFPLDYLIYKNFKEKRSTIWPFHLTCLRGKSFFFDESFHPHMSMRFTRTECHARRENIYRSSSSYIFSRRLNIEIPLLFEAIQRNEGNGFPSYATCVSVCAFSSRERQTAAMLDDCRGSSAVS